MEPTAAEIKRLQGCINDLISVLALPAIWSGHESSQIVSTLLDVLLGMLRLDFAYVSETINGSPIEVLRVAQLRNLAAQPQEVGRALARWLTSAPPTSPLMVPNPVGEGEVSIVRLRLGLQDDVGVLVAGSQRADFPTEIERLLLRVAANQAAIALQEARYLSEQRRAAEEIRFQAGLLDAVDQAVIATDTEGIITYWNRFAERLYGWSAPEVIGRNILDVTRAQGSPRAAAEMRSRWQHGERWTGECLVQHQDGRSFPVLVTDSPIYNSQEVLIGVVRISLDITERKRAEEELEHRVVERTRQLTAVNEELRKEIIERKRAEEEREQLLTREQAARAEAVAAQHRFRDLVNSIEGIVWEADAQTFQFLFVSQQAQRVLGYPVERWLSEPTFWKDHIHPDDRAWAVELCMAATAEQRGRDFEYRMLAADGRSLWLRDLVAVVVEGDRATRLRGVMVDITARKRAEQALREQASLLDLTHDTVFVRDMNDVISYWNRGAEELYGWTREEVVGQVSHRLTQTIFPAPLEEISAELLGTGRWEGELIHTKRDGTQVVVASRWALQRDEHGRPAAILETNHDITARKQAEDALRNSEEQWRAVFEFNPTMYFMVDAAGTVLSVNPFGAEQLGYTVEELVGRSVLHVFDEPDREAAQRNVALCLEQHGPAMSWELRKVRKDGTVLWVHETAKAMRRAQSDPVVLIVCEDITQRKRAEETLRESEERFRRMAETIPEVIWIMAFEPEKMLYVSPGFERIWGLPTEDLYRDSRLRLASVHPEDRARATSAFTQWLEDAGGSTYDVEYRIVQPNGTIRWIHDRGVLIRNEHGKAHRAHGIAEDITERKRAEQALTLFRSLIDHTNDTIEVIDPETGRFLDVNEQACRAHGYTREEYLALTVSEIDPLIGARPWEETMEEVRRSASLIIESQHRRKDGSVFPVEVNANYIRLDRDYHVAVVRDTTERKRAEEALRQTQAELAHVTRVMTMGALTASIAHEVNQPLAAVVTNGNACLRWLAREAPDLEEARATVERIIRDGHRASEVIRRIRALAQKTDPQAAWLDLNDVIHEVIALVHSEVRQQRVALRTELSAALPPVLGDRVQLQQVILNLLINGIEAMQAVADRPREVRIRSQRHEADTVLVAVQDAGIGLDPQQMARLFDAFFTTKPGGMGMGLAISRTIIEAHGGRLWATPNDGPGATFQFALPLNSERPS